MSTMVVPVSWSLDALLKLSTRMSPLVTVPMVCVTGQIAYGLRSPLAGAVEPSRVTAVLPARNDPAAGGSDVAAAASSAAYSELAGAPTFVPLSPAGAA